MHPGTGSCQKPGAKCQLYGEKRRCGEGRDRGCSLIPSSRSRGKVKSCAFNQTLKPRGMASCLRVCRDSLLACLGEGVSQG